MTLEFAWASKTFMPYALCLPKPNESQVVSLTPLIWFLQDMNLLITYFFWLLHEIEIKISWLLFFSKYVIGQLVILHIFFIIKGGTNIMNTFAMWITVVKVDIISLPPFNSFTIICIINLCSWIGNVYWLTQGLKERNFV